MIELVVTRFDEDISWIHSIDLPYKIYNKGKELNCISTNLPNIGREAHTILYHICENFHKIQEYTWFLQGNPFDHFPTILESFQKIQEKIIDGVYLSEGCIGYGKKHYEVFQAYPDILFADALYKDLFFGEVEGFEFTAGAQILVHRENIKHHSLHFYRYCLAKMQNFEEKSGFDAWSFERIWPLIFNKNHICKNRIDAARFM